jgi:hypothetical protein
MQLYNFRLKVFFSFFLSFFPSVFLFYQSAWVSVEALQNIYQRTQVELKRENYMKGKKRGGKRGGRGKPKILAVNLNSQKASQ